MTTEVLDAWLTAFRTSQGPDVPEPLKTQLRQQLIDLLIAIATATPEPTATRRR